MKWLYHTVAREYWNIDRRYWRYLTPHISGGLAFGTTALIASGIRRIFDPSSLHSLASVAGVSFLVGYFSDNAVAKLSEIASTLFGRTEKANHRLPHGYQRTAMSGDADHDSQASPPA